MDSIKSIKSFIKWRKVPGLRERVEDPEGKLEKTEIENVMLKEGRRTEKRLE